MIVENIRSYMRENGIKQEHVANKIGMSKQTMSAILNGNRKLIADEYVDICNALGVSTNKFTNELERQYPEEATETA